RVDKVKIQIFATDIDLDALNVARRGIYLKNSISELTSNQIEKFFTPTEDGSFQIIKKIRDQIIFAKQNLTSDAPFFNLDLVACRNVLIYFNSELQNKVLTTFYCSLLGHGLLFLGRSESCAKQEKMFITLDRQTKIYKKSKEINQLVTLIARSPLLVNKEVHKTVMYKSSKDLLLESICEKYFHAAILLDKNYQIIHSVGKVDDFISFQAGAPDLTLVNLINHEFKSELITLLHKAKNNSCIAVGRKKKIAKLKSNFRLKASVVNKEDGLYSIVFEEVKLEKSDSSIVNFSENNSILENELLAAREHLQTMIEELSIANEEMQALNEEAQASNEEMQASNEELEASNEELQAINEELISVNDELMSKTTQIALLNADFESVYNNIDVPVFVFDEDFILKRFNDTAYETFKISITSIGLALRQIALPDFIKDLEEQIKSMLKLKRTDTILLSNNKSTYKIIISSATNASGNMQSIVLTIIDNTDLVSAQNELESSRNMLLSIMNNSSLIVSLKEPLGKYKFINKKFEYFFGLKSEEILGKTDKQIFNDTISEKLKLLDFKLLQTNTALQEEFEVHINNNSYWLKGSMFLIYNKDGDVSFICSQLSDISSEKHAEEQLKLASKVFSRTGEAILVTDANGRIITANESFTKITGYLITEAVGRTSRLLKSGKHTKEFYERLWNKLLLEGSWQGEILNKRKNGEIYPEWLTINAVKDSDNRLTNYIAIFSDVSAIKDSQRKIEYMATYDQLTGLPNRSLFMDRLRHSISIELPRKNMFAVMFIDLDDFKHINDSLGHDFGDLLLKETSGRLSDCIEDTDTIARLGGDEFTAIISYKNIEDIALIAARIVDILSASYHINGRRLFVSCSIGITLAPNDGTDSTTLLKNADTAMYKAKESGKNQYKFFKEEMGVISLQRMSIENGLRFAMEKNYFTINYQPKISVKSGEISGAEALLRWNDPILGNISPMNFIPIAEKSGLIVKIGEYVMEQVSSDISNWKKSGIKVPKISINVSSIQLKEVNFYDNFTKILNAHNLESKNITIELTESVLIEKQDAVNANLNLLKNNGFSISIDDFGVGYSSLSYLQTLPVTELKIDKSFIDKIEINESSNQIAEAIIKIAKVLNLSTVAEGVETQKQFEILRDLECDEIQGYFFYKPLTKDLFESALLNPGELK
ncbi:MAG: hypothetical protein RL154_182, partial [Pseudomonadota bacterium]